jgi:hypothetical protein
MHPLVEIDRSLACTQWNDAAHLRSRPDWPIPIWFEPSQFCNREFARTAAGNGDRDRAPASRKRQRIQKGIKQGITGLPPAEELGKRWRFFPTYARV